jgi:hypothetical protein
VVRRDNGIYAFHDRELGRKTHRSNCFRLDGDGAAALYGIKEVGEITISQKPDNAGQPDMPESVIASGCIDFILSPEDIVRKIVQIAHEDKQLK